MRAEYLRSWLQEDTWEKPPDPSQWDMVVGLIQSAFRKVHLAEECAWKTVILIPKRSRNFRGIRLVKVLWKTITLNCRLAVAIQFHQILYGFCRVKVTGTASLKSNLPQQLMDMREEVL